MNLLAKKLAAKTSSLVNKTFFFSTTNYAIMYKLLFGSCMETVFQMSFISALWRNEMEQKQWLLSQLW